MKYMVKNVLKEMVVMSKKIVGIYYIMVIVGYF